MAAYTGSCSMVVVVCEGAVEGLMSMVLEPVSLVLVLEEDGGGVLSSLSLWWLVVWLHVVGCLVTWGVFVLYV